MKNWIKKNKYTFINIITFCACLVVLVVFLITGIRETEYITPAKIIMYFAGLFTTFVYLYLWQAGSWFVKKYFHTRVIKPNETKQNGD